MDRRSCVWQPSRGGGRAAGAGEGERQRAPSDPPGGRRYMCPGPGQSLGFDLDLASV